MLSQVMVRLTFLCAKITFILFIKNCKNNHGIFKIRAGNSPVVKALKNLKPMLFNSHFNRHLFPFSLMEATKRKEKVRIKKTYLDYSGHCLI
jgi:hypothetical protein